ncbi:MAG TPA: phosphotransferase [Ktedonobacteraceae bacterium]|jgi:Ser/Thr protein kinase RdoA (MazF antagonist)|nr:phosphotransferase [Ktedonobacteraceae bacterium]
MLEDGLEETAQDLIDLNEVMHAFGVSEWHNLGPVDAGHDGSSGLLVEIAGLRYILKEQPGGLLEEDSSHRYEFQRYLREAGIPVPFLWLTPQGEPTVTIGEDVFELRQWIDGEVYDSKNPRSLRWGAAAGEMLARIHQASHRYPGSEHRWPSEVQAGGLVQGWLNFARAIVEQSEVHAIAAALSNVIDQWEAVLPAAMMSIGSGRGLPEFNIHGDYTPMHLRFEGEAVCTVSGWDASRWEKRLIELAYALFSFSALEWRNDDVLTRPLMKRGFDPERMRNFLAAYGALYPPTPGEATLLVDALMLVTPILTANGPLEDIFYAEENVEEMLIDDVMERLAWATSLPAWLARMRGTIAEMWQ